MPDLPKEEISVWPFKAPPVCTAFWNDADWQEYAKAFRPEGYEGGQFDSDAYLAYKAARLNAMAESHGLPKLSPPQI